MPSLVEVGEGHSSPVVVGDQVFVFSRQGEREVVRAMNLADGQQLWSRSYPAPYTMSPPARGHGKGPKSTPIVVGDRLVTLGISGVLSCWDTGSGDLVWRREFSNRFRNTWPVYGNAMSPMIDRSRVVAFVGGEDDGALIAFRLANGKPVWQWPGDGPSYASPIVATVAGSRQVIAQSQEACVGVSARSAPGR